MCVYVLMYVCMYIYIYNTPMYTYAYLFVYWRSCYVQHLCVLNFRKMLHEDKEPIREMR